MIEYFPILKWKTGERIALSHFSIVEDQMMPVIQIIDNVEPKVFFDEMKKSFLGPIYFDTANCAEEDETKSILQSLIYYAGENNIPAYPIIEYSDIDMCHNELEKCGIYVSVPNNFNGESFEDIISKIDKYTSSIEIDLFLNAGLITTNQEAKLAFSTYIEDLSILSKYPNFSKFIICLTSFPKNLSSLKSGETEVYERYDIEIFNKLRRQNKLKGIKEKLHYADYGVTKYTESDINFRLMHNDALPNVKYTVQDKYIVMKGANKPQQVTYAELAKLIEKSSYYYGETFSYGDEEIHNKAQGTNKGSNMNWVTYCCNHHIAAVLEQLSRTA